MTGITFRPRPSLIEGYKHAGGWVVEGHLYLPAMCITRTRVQSFGALSLDAVGAGHLPEDASLLLLGTGARLLRPPPALVTLARSRGIHIEAMDSAAAARTFNLLVQEDREVAALLL